MLEQDGWRQLPEIERPAVVLALTALGGRLWAGGPGGVAVHSAEAGWEAQVAGLHLSAVAALAATDDGLLLAGGAQGIARSTDAGQSWRLVTARGEVGRVGAIALAPDFASNGTVLAASVGDGVLRSADGGGSWESANFGLPDLDVSALAWLSNESALAGTADGVYRSPNGGRAWRAARGSEGLAVAALVVLPGGSALAALEQGGLLRSRDGTAWEAWGDLPADLEATALLASESCLLLGSSSHGLLRSTDGGQRWQQVSPQPVLALAAAGDLLWAGGEQGIHCSTDGGEHWLPLPPPPIHDLRQLLVGPELLLVAGTYAGALRHRESEGWQPLATPTPLAALAVAPDAALLAADPLGLLRSSDGGQSWQRVAEAPLGQLARLSFDSTGEGWAGAADGGALLHTRDGGRNWEAVATPFGVFALLALEALPGRLLAVVYDPRQQLAQPWRSNDGGQSWERGQAVRTPWPLAASAAHPPLFSLGDALHYERPDGAWETAQIGPQGSAVRRVVAAGDALLALTTEGVYRSDNGAASWLRCDQSLPDAQVIDIALAAGQFYALLPGGRVWTRPL